MSSPPLIVRLHDQAAVRLPRRLTPAPGPDPAPASGPPAGLACANWSSCRGQHRSLRQASRRWPSHDDTSSPPTHLWPATGDSQSRHIPCPLRSLHAKRSRAEPVRVLRPRTQSPRLAWLQRSKLALIQRSVPRGAIKTRHDVEGYVFRGPFPREPTPRTFASPVPASMAAKEVRTRRRSSDLKRPPTTQGPIDRPSTHARQSPPRQLFSSVLG
jgi:hypothetical protein